MSDITKFIIGLDIPEEEKQLAIKLDEQQQDLLKLLQLYNELEIIRKLNTMGFQLN